MNLKINYSAAAVMVIVALGVGVFLWNLQGSTPSPSGLVLPRFSALAAAGTIAFNNNCASCHGINATGSDQGPPLIHDIYNPGHHNDASFYRAVGQGTPRHHWNFGDMPPQPQVTYQDVTAILSYIRELQEANGIVWKQHTM